MDWIKVKTVHILDEYADMAPLEFQAWIKIMALAARLEHQPTREQILKHVHHATLKKLDDTLMKHGCRLDDVLMKVQCDVDGVLMKRESWKNNKKQYREVKQNPVPVVSMDVSIQDKSKSKIRVDTNIKRGFHPPSVSEVSAYCLERQNTVNPQQWIDHYTSNGWMVGKNRMKDWKAAVRTWEQRGGMQNVGIRTNRSDPRDTSLQSRTDADCAAITAAYYARKAAEEAARSQAGGNASHDDAPDFQGV